MAEERFDTLASASENGDSGVLLLKNFRKFAVGLTSNIGEDVQIQSLNVFVDRYIALKKAGKINCDAVRVYLNRMNNRDEEIMHKFLACLNELSLLTQDGRWPVLLQRSRTFNLCAQKAKSANHEYSS